ncbi:MAG: beta-ketoacyl synthase chain length factor [Myxococcota bacterium]
MSANGATRAQVLSWSAWSPGLEDPAAWEAWAGAPAPLLEEGHPSAEFLPAMLRRRCTPLTRIALTTAFGALAGEEGSAVRTVFASRHGSINESLELLHAVVGEQRLSPTKFSHTVHNAQAGLFCIAAGNRRASSSLAARDDTFACGWLEALTHLERDPGSPVLLVMGDVALAPTFAALVTEPPGAYGLGLLLAREDEGPSLDLDLAGRGEANALPWPDAMEFLRFLLTGEERLEIGRFGWTRAT